MLGRALSRMLGPECAGKVHMEVERDLDEAVL